MYIIYECSVIWGVTYREFAKKQKFDFSWKFVPGCPGKFQHRSNACSTQTQSMLLLMIFQTTLHVSTSNDTYNKNDNKNF